MYNEQFKIIQDYKISCCDLKKCKYKSTITNSKIKTQTPTYDCFYFHNNNLDRRRPPFINGLITYSPLVSEQAIRFQGYFNIKETDCNNGYEYLYHPLNYKTVQCPQNQKEVCHSIYCPYFHSIDEWKMFTKYRSDLQKFNQEIKNIKLGNCLNDAENELDSEFVDKNQNIMKNCYLFNEKVNFIEDHCHEFKDQKLHIYTITRYVAGFLNSKGGTLYYGIDDNGLIKGVDIKDYEMDIFKKKVYEELFKFKPKVDSLVNIKFIPVYYLKTQNPKLISNTYVLEIRVQKGSDDEIYFTSYGEIHVRRSASINQLKTSDIRSFKLFKSSSFISLYRDYIKYKLKRKEGLALEELEKKVIFMLFFVLVN